MTLSLWIRAVADLVDVVRDHVSWLLNVAESLGQSALRCSIKLCDDVGLTDSQTPQRSWT